MLKDQKGNAFDLGLVLPPRLLAPPRSQTSPPTPSPSLRSKQIKLQRSRQQEGNRRQPPEKVIRTKQKKSEKKKERGRAEAGTWLPRPRAEMRPFLDSSGGPKGGGKAIYAARLS